MKVLMCCLVAMLVMGCTVEATCSQRKGLSAFTKVGKMKVHNNHDTPVDVLNSKDCADSCRAATEKMCLGFDFHKSDKKCWLIFDWGQIQHQTKDSGVDFYQRNGCDQQQEKLTRDHAARIDNQERLVEEQLTTVDQQDQAIQELIIEIQKKSRGLDSRLMVLEEKHNNDQQQEKIARDHAAGIDNNQDRLIEQLHTTVEELRTTVEELHTTVEELHTTVEELHTTVDQQDQAIQELKMENQENCTGLDSRLMVLEEKHNNDRVAFSAVLTDYDITRPPGSIIVLNKVSVNDGEGYNSSTGIFTVPSGGDGLYYFNIHIYTSGFQSKMLILINEDRDRPVCTGRGSCSGLAYLVEGDMVCLVLKDGYSIVSNQVMNGLTGFKLW